jgi:hypothetical protein
MYANLDIQDVVTRATKTVACFRGRLLQAYATAEVFIGEKRLVLGGGAGLSAVLSKEYPLDPLWEVYSNRPYSDAKELTHTLFEDFGDVYLRTVMKNQELIVVIAGRSCFKICRRGRDVGQPVSAHGWYTGVEILCAPVMSHLARIYQTLYTPEQCSEWTDLLTEEAELYDMLPHAVVNVRLTGSPPALAIRVAVGLKCILAGWSADTTSVISDIAPTILNQRLKKLLGASVVAKEHEQGIAGDFRLSRDEYIVQAPAKHIISVYNSTTYECLPCVNVGDAFVVAGWARLKFQAVSGTLSAADRQEILNGAAVNAFPQDSYFGDVEVVGVTRKKLVADEHRIADYYPTSKNKESKRAR